METTEKFAYIVYTVNARYGFGSETVVYGESADAIADEIWARGGYRMVDVAPCAPVNGFTGLPYKSGDTASRKVTK